MLLIRKKARRAARPPEYLSESAKKFWKSVIQDYELSDHHLKLLETACASLDRAEEARRIISENGLTVTNNKGDVRPHPAVGIETTSRKLFASALRELGLDVRSSEPARPPYLPSYSTGSKREVR